MISLIKRLLSKLFTINTENITRNYRVMKVIEWERLNALRTRSEDHEE